MLSTSSHPMTASAGERRPTVASSVITPSAASARVAALMPGHLVNIQSQPLAPNYHSRRSGLGAPPTTPSPAVSASVAPGFGAGGRPPGPSEGWSHLERLPLGAMSV